MLALACGQPLRASELYQHAKDPAGWLRDMAMQWRAAIPGGNFLDALEHLKITRTWAPDGRRDFQLEHSGDRVSSTVDPLWSHSFGLSWRFSGQAPINEVGQYFPIHTALQSMHLSGAFSDDALRHAVDPLLTWAPELMISFVGHGPRDYVSVAHSLVALWLTSAQRAEPEKLLHAYQQALHGSLSTGAVDAAVLVLNSLENDAPRLERAALHALLDHVLEVSDHSGVTAQAAEIHRRHA
ncbi:hypothetical protein OHA21_25850 [Actinoplanes sp. NBC_00393]|uniref:hypothetical protein n=1 Tax=Actinoplanes sp. NBC_00393 TaxID=2975953 RepID=UPI002E1C2441